MNHMKKQIISSFCATQKNTQKDEKTDEKKDDLKKGHQSKNSENVCDQWPVRKGL